MTQPFDWEAVRDDLNVRQDFIAVPDIIAKLEIAIPNDYTNADIVAAVAANSRLNLAKDRGEIASKMMLGETVQLGCFVGLGVEDIYERGQEQASIAHKIINATGVSRALVESIPPFLEVRLTTQVDCVERVILWND